MYDKRSCGGFRRGSLDIVSNCGKPYSYNDLTSYRIAGSPTLTTTCGKAQPDFSIKLYGHDIYKVIYFRRSFGDNIVYLKKVDKSKQESHEGKLSNNLSRDKSIVLQLALCNHWEWFFTATLDEAKMNRFDVNAFRSKLTQFIRDKRKEYKTKINYLLVPERHKDGAWHMHGFISGLPASVLSDFIQGKHPQKLIKGGYKNWQDYADKFGFCSLGAIRNPIGASMYLVKYLTKDLAEQIGRKGQHLYFASRPLNRAESVCDGFGHRSELKPYLQYDYDFCSVGMTKQDWTFPLQFDDTITYNPDFDFVPLAPEKDFHPSELTLEWSHEIWEQMKME